MIEMHRNYLDNMFEAIITNLYPLRQPNYWSDLEGSYARNFDVVKRYQQCDLSQTQEFKENYSFSEIDNYVISFAPDQKQFEFLQNNLAKEVKIKESYQKAVDYLYQAKNLISQATSDAYSFDNLVATSKIFEESQLLNSQIMDKFRP